MTNRRIKVFEEYFTEESDKSKIKTSEEIADELKYLKELSAFAMVSDAAVKAKKLELVRNVGGTSILQDPVFGPIITSDIFKAVESEEFKKLAAVGFVVKSNERQLVNGTLVIGRPNSNDNLGIFSNRYLRRVTGEDKGFLVRDLEGAGPELYVNGMRWVLQHLDINDPKLRSFRTIKTSNEKGSKMTDMLTKIKEQFEIMGFNKNQAELLISQYLISNLNYSNFSTSNLTRYYQLVRKAAQNGIVCLYGLAYDKVFTPKLEKFVVDSKIPWIMSDGHSSRLYFGVNSYERKSPGVNSGLTYLAIPHFDIDLFYELHPEVRSYFSIEFANLPITQDLLNVFSGSQRPTLKFHECTIVEDVSAPKIDEFNACVFNANVSTTYSGFQRMGSAHEYVELSGAKGTGSLIITARKPIVLLLKNGPTSNLKVHVKINGVDVHERLKEMGLPIDQFLVGEYQKTGRVYVNYTQREAEIDSVTRTNNNTRTRNGEYFENIIVI